jgi:RNA recognition motif-containing protein
MAKIYVGNLPFSATEDQVRALFAAHGTVESVALPNDRETGRPRGFGFVEMSQADAARAIQAVNGQDLGGRALRVNEAQDKPRTGGGGGGGRSGGGGGYGGGGGGGRSGGGGGGYGGGGGGGGGRW